MSYYEGCPELDAVLNKHKASANSMLSTAQSQLLCDTFSKGLAYLFSTNESAEGDVLNLNVGKIKTKINKWKNDIDDCYESFLEKMKAKDELTDEDQMKILKMNVAVREIKQIYVKLSEEMDGVELDFQNAVRLYRSPIRAALTDISMLYNSEKNVKGDFSGFENVSVYVHGIEDDGRGFLRSVKEIAERGDVIIHIKGDGSKEYFYIDIKTKEIIEYNEDFSKLSADVSLDNIKTRLHIIYDTENKNEHRQETSDDLARKFSEMGLMNNKTKIDMFAQSYGGRRSLQFAIDYPDHVRSITTIGTPYDTNMLGKVANDVRWFAETDLVKKNPKETSDYIDFNEKNRNDTNGLKYSNAYTDLSSEPLTEDINKLKSADPEVYKKLQKMEIKAVAGYKKSFGFKIPSDDVVSVESQNADILGDLIDERPEIEVEGMPGHIYQIEDQDFINLMEEVNKNQMSRGN
ncbi:alpha/beta fold hydrolase [Metabacillus fastidiosus]|uniref:alpha/beta fold hydrolase n=1 Tax=Metabacillus fastidiosus TaxID=1458 RepID=UPI003D2E7E3A